MTFPIVPVLACCRGDEYTTAALESAESMMHPVALPEFIFFSGAPGSRWSGIAQIVERHPGIDTSDRRTEREYRHSGFSGHVGAYFGPGMEFDAVLDSQYLRTAWDTDGSGTKVLKSHHWTYCLEDIAERFPSAWIMLVWRDDEACSKWWDEAGGFEIRYPSYSWYENSVKMDEEIRNQNRCILEFAARRESSWSPFDADWVGKQFGIEVVVPDVYGNIYVTLYKPG